MSAAGGIPDGDEDEDRIVLAGEYVLGTLPFDERSRVDAEMPHDSGLRAAVADWEHRLAPLAGRVRPLAPPAAVWRRIERGMRDARSVPVAQSVNAPVNASPGSGGSRRAAPVGSAIWKGVTAASFLLAAGIAFVVLLDRVLLDRVPMPVPVAALSPMGSPAAAFVVEARADGTVEVLPLHPAPVPAGHDLELWSLAAGDVAPRPLGVLPVGGRRLRAGLLPRGNAKILVSLEPRGGSPTGLPTGAVLYGGTVLIRN